MFTYLFINLSVLSIPLVYSFHKRLNFYGTWYAFWPAAFITGTLFILWDIYFTNLGVWGFNSDYLIGVNWLGLPSEEWLFFICIPYACVFTYHCLNALTSVDYLANQAKKITWVLILVLSVTGILNLNRIYTSMTFLSTGAFLTIHLVVLKSNFLGRFYFTYAVLLIPCILTNGILTGSLIPEQVVWYNNVENLGIRFLTIPVEDFIYGLLLILMNVTIYEAIISKKNTQVHERKNSKAGHLSIPI